MDQDIKPALTAEQIEQLTLDSGNHTSPDHGHCLLEVVSLFAGEPFGDSPQCVDPVLAEFGRSWNDGLPDDQRQQLKRYIPLLSGTNQGRALSLQRSWMAGDWLLRVCLPTWLDLVKDDAAIAALAAELRTLPPVTDQPGLDRALSALDNALPALQARAAARYAARDAAWAAARDAAWAAARDAARAAARDAARAAARDAARDAARAAAWAAARDAAWAAARDAAWAAARDAAWAAAWDAAQTPPDGKTAYQAAYDAAMAAIGPTCAQLQSSAHDLYLSMINAELREHAASEAEVQP